MEKAGGSKPATRFGFGFSWADEVEREEREQEQLVAEEQIPVQRLEAKKEQQTKVNPFGAARPREVVLAEKGVDWRARDLEIDAAFTRGPRLVAVPAALPPAAPNCGRTVPPPALTRRSTPARRKPRDRGGSGRTLGPRRHDAETTTPQAKDAPPVSRSAWGGGKRKCAAARDVPGAATARRARAVGDRWRRVFGELNVDEGCASSFRNATNKTCNLGGSVGEWSKAREAAVADGGGSRGCSGTATAATATEDQSAVGQKRKGGKRGRKGGSKKTENQQPLLL
ncbi:hypothetical protein PR202_gb20527 [Eleusine coracana subsp. coracana]|uniref:Uncharacterized protein n=1 Tax=Eleusine coracana subsp. coracana TaxID=191504 RepID=A0AAV5FCR8_ELECO|nr:hypothetical protein QOZ80_1BG0063060 [Eleusine coracana subsp. coracana]GJN32055.1 hypothetical protein PR202_gb20527 [Eleusine coracana subsp. coracana]